jgi:hypothetical protein
MMKRIALVLIVGLVLGISNTASAATDISYPDNGEPWLDVDGAGGISILETLYGANNWTRVDDAYDQTWIFTGSTGTAMAEAKFANFSQCLYVGTSYTDIHEVLSLGAYGNGYKNGSPSGTFSPDDLNGSLIFRFLDDPIGTPYDPPRFSSVPSENLAFPAEHNVGRDRMVTWRINSGPSAGNYVMGWEDGNDWDHNDMVYEFSGVRPVTPEPASMALLSLGLVGLVGRKLRKKFMA